MKKTILVLIILLTGLSVLFAVLSPVDHRGFQITAQKGEVHEVSITPIVASSLEAKIGIPFDLTDTSVSYSSANDAVTGKRRIATWSMYSNKSKPKVEIDADPLAHSDGTTINYQLSFYYQFSYGESYIDGDLIVTSGEHYDSSLDDSCLWNDYDVPVAFAGRPVRLMLDDVDVKSDEYPSGSYRANITIRINGQ